MRLQILSAMQSMFASSFPLHLFPLKMDDVECSTETETKIVHTQERRVRRTNSQLALETSDGSKLERIQRTKNNQLFYASCKKGAQYHKQGQYEDALLEYKIALQSKFKTIESEPKDVQEEFCNVLHEIADIHCMSGHDDIVKGMKALEFCLDIRRSCFGSNHRSVAVILTKLASVYSNYLEHQHALDLLLEALSIYLTSSLPDEEEIDNRAALKYVWNAIGKAQHALGHDDDAQSSYEEALKIK